MENVTSNNTSTSQWEVFESMEMERNILFVLELLFGLIGLFFQGSLSLVCIKMRERRYNKGRKKNISEGRIINNLTMAQFITVFIAWLACLPIILVRTLHLEQDETMKGLCLFWTFCKVATYYILNYIYLGNTVVRFLYYGYVDLALKFEAKRPTRHIMVISVLIASALGVKRVFYPKSSTTICYADLSRSNRVRQPGGLILPVVFGLAPLVLNGILNVFVFIFRSRKLQRTSGQNKKERKSKNWASAKVHLITVMLYAYIVVASMSKSLILKRYMYGKYAVFFNMCSDLHMNIILGIVLPIIYLVASPSLSKRVRSLWKNRNMEGQEWESDFQSTTVSTLTRKRKQSQLPDLARKESSVVDAEGKESLTPFLTRKESHTPNNGPTNV